MSDVELLNQHRDGSATAFADIVRRHLGWVYGVARRRLRDAQLAEDVAQAVFILLHRKAPRFAADGAMICWLHKTAWYASESAARSERRRRRREGQAATMAIAGTVAGRASDVSADGNWQEFAPLLDELIERLSQLDREAILLRYYRDLPFSQIGEQLGTTEEAARKRVTRAVEKLRALANKKGIDIPVATIVLGFAQQMHLAPPAGLIARAITAACASNASALATSSGSILKGMIFMTAQTKLAIGGVVAVALLLGGATYVMRPSQPKRVNVSQVQPPKVPGNPVSGRGYPTLAPYTNVRWDGNTPQVQYNGGWYELVALNEIPASQIVQFCQKTYGNIWQKRFNEDLVEVLATMGKPAGGDVSLRLRSLDQNVITDVPHAAMTEENRQALWKGVNSSTVLSSGQGFARLAPYSGVRWNGAAPEVKVGADWVELVAIDDVPAADIVQFCHKTYGGLWQKRFEEDLVEVFAAMNKPIGDTAKLDLRSLDTKTASVVQAPMTAENRKAILQAGQGRKVAARR